MTVKNPNFMTAVTLKQSAQSDSNPFHKENNEALLNFEEALKYVKGLNSSN